MDITKKIDDGGAAFPVPVEDLRDMDAFYNHGACGMTLRDYFAAKAMQSYIAKSPYVPKNPDWANVMRKVSQSAYAYADAMIAARKSQ